jgi:hypothetical protein
MSWRTREARAFADALGGARPTSRDVAALIAVAERLCAAAAEIQPSPRFQSSLRTTLVAEAPTVLVAHRATPRQRRRSPFAPRARRRAAAVAAVLATTFGLLGMTTASASALPGEALYPVKRGIESTELALTRGDSRRGTFRLELASERLRETTGLTERHSAASALAGSTLRDFSEQASLGSEALVRSFKATNQRADIVAINEFADHAAGQLQRLTSRLDGRAVVALAAARNELAGIIGRSASVCPICGGLDPHVVNTLTASAGGEAASPHSSPPEAVIETQPAPAPVPAVPTHTASSQSESSSDSDASSDSSDDANSDSDSDSDRSHQVVPAPVPSPSPTASATVIPTATPTCKGDKGGGNGEKCHGRG